MVKRRKKRQRNNNDIQNITQKFNDRATRTPRKTWDMNRDGTYCVLHDHVYAVRCVAVYNMHKN